MCIVISIFERDFKFDLNFVNPVEWREFINCDDVDNHRLETD